MQRIKVGMIALAALAVAGTAAPASAMCVAASRFEGTWRGNDGGTYQMRQSGNRVTWIGRSGDGGRTWTHRFEGTRTGNVASGQWVDLPPGRIRSRGAISVRLERGVITRISATGGFGGSRWTKPCNDVVLNPVDG